MQRFYIENFTFFKSLNITDVDLLNQMQKVLRFRAWDKFIVFDWNTSEDYIYLVKEINKKNILSEFIEKVNKKDEASFINLYVSMPNKLDKIEMILQKWTEIWVKSFSFFYSERSQKLHLSENKITRLSKIIKEAVEQSWRNIVPSLNFYDTIPDISNGIFFHTQNENSKWIFDVEMSWDLSLIIWPEWWFTNWEITSFEASNFQRVHLWNNILRCETCAIATSFFLHQAKIKDLN